MAGKWNGTNGSGWSFNSKDYSDYISDEEIFDIVQSTDKKTLNEFTETEQIRLASFVLNYSKEDMDYVTEQEALKLVNEWKKT